MRISELRASHLATLDSSVTVTRADGQEFTVDRTEWQGERYYRVWHATDKATFGDSLYYFTTTTIRGVVSAVKSAVVDDVEAAAYRLDIARRADATAEKLSLTAREFLGTRVAVAGVCAALGVSPEDGVVEECLDDDGNATADIPGWTYMDGWGSIIYMVAYPNGKIGAQFGSKSVYADTLDLAELELFALLCDARSKELTDIYTYWCGRQGLPAMSADELIFEELTAEQRAWVSAFINIWECA